MTLPWSTPVGCDMIQRVHQPSLLTTINVNLDHLNMPEGVHHLALGFHKWSVFQQPEQAARIWTWTRLLAGGKLPTRIGTNPQRESCHHQNLAPRQWLSHSLTAQRMHHMWPERAEHLSADLELQSNHHPSWDSPNQLQTHPPRHTRPLGGLHHISESILNTRAVATELWIAPSKNRVTFAAPHCEGSIWCRKKCFLCNCRQVFLFLNCILQSFWAVSTCPWSVTSFKKPTPNFFCAATFKSPRVDAFSKEKVALWPLGKDTLTWIMAVFAKEKAEWLRSGILKGNETIHL